MNGTDDSPARGLKGMLSRNRRGRDDTPGSQKSNRSARDDSSESAPEKFKARPSLAGLEDDVMDATVPKAPSSPRKRKEKGASQPEAAKGAGDADKDPDWPLPKGSPGIIAGENGNSTANGISNDAEGGATFTSGSESEHERSRPLARSTPALPSQVANTGNLTSSPQVKATIGNAAAGTSTLSVNSGDSPSGSKSRSRSPGARLKDAFKPSSKRSIGSLRDAPKSPGFSDQGKGDTIAARRSKSIVETSSSTHPYVNTSKSAAASRSDKSLPSIVMTPGTPPPPIPSSSFEKLPLNADLSTTLDEYESESSKGENGSTGAKYGPLARRKSRTDSLKGPPSKLGNSMNPPLTPMIEEVKTPPSSRNASTSSNSGGFFTSMFSVAQNAASTFTTTLNANRPKSSSSAQTQSNDDEKTPKPGDFDKDPAQAGHSDDEGNEPAKAPAIETIGSGELSLSHLGISSEALPTASSSKAASISGDSQNRSRSGTVVRREEASAREEGISAARAVSAAYEDEPPEILTPMVEESQDTKIASVLDSMVSEKPTTPTGSVLESEGGGIHRSSSLKNKLDRKRRRRGGSQSTTGGPIIPSASSLTTANGSVPKLSGFAVASKKRNRDFHMLFKSVPEEDYLIEDYSCALQRDIILAGRLYISESHICFSSNILGWVTTLVISFDEVVSVEKEVTAMVFPNAIAVQTLHARHTFRSLLSRETTYDLLIGIWKISHPGLLSSENGVRVASGTGSKTEKLEGASENESEGSEDAESGDEDASAGSGDDDASSLATDDEGAAAADSAPSPPKSTIPRKPSNLAVAAGQAVVPPTVGEAKAAAAANGAALASVDFPGPQAHGPTECSDSGTHYPNLLKDEVIPAPLGKIYSMMFGNASGGFMSRWLVDEMKVLELQMEDDKKGLGDDNKSRSFSYIKPLGGSIGPKQTKCIITEQLDSLDLEKAASITVTTQTPDVPSGNVFSTKTRYCLMWGPNNGTRMIMSCAIEWTGKSWLKGPIEKGANDGQAAYANDLYKALRAAVSKGKAPGTPGKTKKSSKKRKGEEGEKARSAHAASSEEKRADWGVLEPLHGILGPVADLLGPIVSLQTLVAVLLVFLVLSWTRGSLLGRGGADGLPRTSHMARLAAYEELWRSEESALWTWLDERVGGAEGLSLTHAEQLRINADRRPEARRERQHILGGKPGGRAMGEKEVRRAVEITEEKLRILKEIVQDKHAAGEEKNKDEL